MRRLAARWFVAFALGALPWLAGAQSAQSFPTAPITLVVPLAPGDAADIASRALSEELSAQLKTPVVVLNRPGAGGAVGTNAVVQAKKDGHTLLFAQNSALTFRAVMDPASLSYDTFRDLVPLGTSSRTPSVLVVRSDAPYRTFAQMLEYAKANPGKVRIGHPGAGSVGDFGVQLINALTGADLVSVPFAGAAPSVVALRGGHIEGVVLSLGALTTHIRSGALRGLVTSTRFPEFADIPTLRELGYPEELFGIWFSFLAPAGIPDDTRKALVAAVERAVKDPAITARLAPLGILQIHATPEETTAEIRDEIRRASEVAKKTGVVK